LRHLTLKSLLIKISAHRDNISFVREIRFSADELVAALLALSERESLCLLDSCGVSYLDSHLLIAGIRPLETFEITESDAEKTLEFVDEKFSKPNLAHIFSISYDFGLKLERLKSRRKEVQIFSEPDVFLESFDCLIVHDYNTGKTFLTGNEKRFDEIERALREKNKFDYADCFDQQTFSSAASNLTRESYVEKIEEIKEHIRRGETYQTNLTQQIRVALSENLTAQKIFWRLRNEHPAPFAAFLKRENDSVVSISPERFFRVESRESRVESRTISTSPIKGTRPRGQTLEEDLNFKNQLLNSAKDRAENTMIVDLLRNDLGRICEFGTVAVEKLCDLETHPTLFHLVSTIKGELRKNTKFSDILKAVFPCGSITGAPKISTMQIIDELETANRGLSMGAIGYSIPNSKFKIQGSRFKTRESENLDSRLSTLDLSVAIRTMVIRNQTAVFNVGGGIVIDSVPEAEYEESLLKAKALLKSLDAKLPCD
jgi:para-aminobenzoate synthetase component 1